ncbi:hypothetical protein [Cryptosporangium sp. NPDC048952]|uniref:hypothetical protein n=1 Tax=Cryptosporangium sp. NPDC048952 TaxID=3363961 RepID=UPI00371BF9F9
MACDLTNPVTCVGPLPGEFAASVGLTAWEAVCREFGTAAASVLKSFAEWFVVAPSLDLGSPGIRNVYAISLGIAGSIAAILLLLQVLRTVITHQGAPLAHGLVGVGKAALAFMVTLTVASAGLAASEELAQAIINQSFDSADDLHTNLGAALSLTLSTSPTLLLIVAILVIAMLVVLWLEMLLVNGAIAVLVATSPIAAVGQISESTTSWWTNLCVSTLKLLAIKPTVALVFTVGLGIAGEAELDEVATQLSGLLILLLAVLAWPAIGRLFTFVSVHSGGGAGLASVLGMAANTVNARSGGGAPRGVPPGQFGGESEDRVMASFAERGGDFGAAGAGGGGAAAAGGVGAAVVAAVGQTLDVAQRASNSLVGRMEQTAGHAGMQGASPWPYPAGYPRGVPPAMPRRPAENGAPPPDYPTAEYEAGGAES